MRLTIKQRNDELCKTFIDGVSVDYLTADLNASRVMNKLGQLEDIEEELGIDLITLFKALRDGIYVHLQEPYGIIHDTIRPKFEGKYVYLVLDTVDSQVCCRNYGKSWALTKEELL